MRMAILFPTPGIPTYDTLEASPDVYASTWPTAIQIWLGERKELDNIYNAIGALSMKYQEPPKKDKPNPVGFAATEARYEDERRKKREEKQ